MSFFSFVVFPLPKNVFANYIFVVEHIEYNTNKTFIFIIFIFKILKSIKNFYLLVKVDIPGWCCVLWSSAWTAKRDSSSSSSFRAMYLVKMGLRFLNRFGSIFESTMQQRHTAITNARINAFDWQSFSSYSFLISILF